MRRWYRWWYAAIGVGFTILGLNVWLTHYGSPWLRWLIAAGFFLLAWLETRRPAK